MLYLLYLELLFQASHTSASSNQLEIVVCLQKAWRGNHYATHLGTDRSGVVTAPPKAAIYQYFTGLEFVF